MNERELRGLLDFAVEIAHDAGVLTLGYFQSGLRPEYKSDRSPVTVADRGAEELLRNKIEAAYPDHGIVGEEHGEKLGRAPARWILDPIDGTQSFICGVPLYSVLVGLEWEGRMIVGVIHLPALRETVCAARGLGCWWNGRRARVSNVERVADARLVVTSVKLFHQHQSGAAYERLCDACRLDRGWSDAYAYALLATGRCDLVADPMMSIWDSAALLPCVTEAGGAFTDWDGVETHTAPSVLASNGRLHDAALRLVRG